MKIIFLICVTMVSFASNSVLNRVAVDSEAIDPSSFAMIRVFAGAMALVILVVLRSDRIPIGSVTKASVFGAVSLSAYMVGFSLAYVTLDAGLGALILFGTVQVSMFGWGALSGSRPSRRQLFGAATAFAGLVLALWPSETNGVDASGALLMLVAGLGWAAYTLLGRKSKDPLVSTATNFLLATPMLFVLLIGAVSHAALSGIALAILSGAVTSGMGYALWYQILPSLSAQSAAVVQLSVPIIAIVAGAMLLGELISIGVVAATAMVLGGIALAVTAPEPQADRNTR